MNDINHGMNNSLWIVAAMRDEIRDLLKNFEPDTIIHLHPAMLWQGDWKGRTVIFLVTGLGKNRMRAGLTKAFSVCKPDQVLHIGYAGSTTPLVTTGKLIAADRIVDEKSEKEYRPDAGLLKLINALSDKTGSLLTVSKVIEDPMEKAALGTHHQCVAVDMESSACADFCEERKIPWSVARSILDSLDMQLPVFPTQHERGEPQVTDVLMQTMLHPKEMMQIPHLQYCASQARNRLTQFVTEFLLHESTIVREHDRTNL